jgi:hypothetical protein
MPPPEFFPYYPPFTTQQHATRPPAIPVPPASFSDATRPAATEFVVGTWIFNTDDGAPNWSDGTVWRDSDGNET